MTPEQAFLADILANPDDDTPRLIYADWLEEDGPNHRAELIRVQCELAKLPDMPDNPKLISPVSFVPDRPRRREMYPAIVHEQTASAIVRDTTPEAGEVVWLALGNQIAGPWTVLSVMARVSTRPRLEFDLDLRNNGPPQLIDRKQWDQAAALHRRERELLQQHREEWFPLWDTLWAGLEAQWNGLSDPAEFCRSVRLMQMLNAAFPGITFTLPPPTMTVSRGQSSQLVHDNFHPVPTGDDP